MNLCLIVTRFIRYYKENSHYYFFDYCYYVGLYCAIVLWWFPDNITLLKIAFLHAGGSLPLSMIYLKSKLVFHNFELLTSFYMHYTWFAVMFSIRHWHMDESSGIALSSAFEEALQNWSILNYFKHVGIAFITYMIWSLFYYVMIFKVKKDYIKEHNIETLYSYTLERGDFNSICLRFGEKYSPIMYMVWHAGSSSIAFFISSLMLKYHFACVLGMIIYLISPVYWGSNYYFNFFSRTYIQKTEKKAEENKSKVKSSELKKMGVKAHSSERVTEKLTEKKRRVILNDLGRAHLIEIDTSFSNSDEDTSVTGTQSVGPILTKEDSKKTK